jgi:hypothetical protein
MVPVDVAPLEARQFRLLLQRSGADPASFRLRKLADIDSGNYKVRVVGRSAATVYEAREPGAWTRQFASDLESGVFGQPGAAEPPAPVAALLGQFREALTREGLAGGLRFLNQRVPHRFTAIYRLEGPLLRNVAMVDKHLHLEPLDLQVVPLKDSFCQFVLRDGLFLTTESGGDERLAGHPYRGVMGCYVGVPVSRTKGTLEGTLCHFDLQSHDLADEEYMLLERAAGLLAGLLR